MVAAVGRPEMIKGSWIKPGAVVIDVGINRTSEGKLVGDVEFASAHEKSRLYHARSRRGRADDHRYVVEKYVASREKSGRPIWLTAHPVIPAR